MYVWKRSCSGDPGVAPASTNGVSWDIRSEDGDMAREGGDGELIPKKCAGKEKGK